MPKRGPKPLGPRPLDPVGKPVDIPAPVVELQDRGLNVGIPAEQISGLLAPFNGRARTVIIKLLAGWSRGMAAAAAGVDSDTVRDWEKRDPEFAQATAKALNLGFAAVYESELYDRALDRSDRGSMRALELVVKARSPEYREKNQLQIEVLQRVEQAGSNLLAGWDPASESSD